MFSSEYFIISYGSKFEPACAPTFELLDRKKIQTKPLSGNYEILTREHITE